MQRGCGKCHDCGTPLTPEHYCPKCGEFRRYTSHGAPRGRWNTHKDTECPKPKPHVENLVKKILEVSSKFKYPTEAPDPNPEIKAGDMVRATWLERGKDFSDGEVVEKGYWNNKIHYMVVSFGKSDVQFEAGFDDVWYATDNPTDPVKVTKLNSYAK